MADSIGFNIERTELDRSFIKNPATLIATGIHTITVESDATQVGTVRVTGMIGPTIGRWMKHNAFTLFFVVFDTNEPLLKAPKGVFNHQAYLKAREMGADHVVVAHLVDRSTAMPLASQD